ncbi:TerC family protein [Blattabacterium cuenoti]|uniref:TerC family protein n=1 Tax=Blattabacterium cuenoti TaxID=1653831 RepID=UPI00163BD44B|nr:DUF475 domain-containing protein [Blattabacterium cuenoti]
MKDIIFNSILDIAKHPILSISIIVNLFFIESILSIDNAIILSSFAIGLKKEERKKAFKYGIIGAYLFRGITLAFASILIKIWWLKPLGGLYLIYLGLRFFLEKKIFFSKKKERKNTNSFWFVIFSMELMDLVFSIDNIFSSVALSENIILIFLGVSISILTMRFFVQKFIKLIENIPSLKKSTCIVILLLGIKLLISSFEKKKPIYFIFRYVECFFPYITVVIFFFPIIMSYIYHNKKELN